MRVRRRALLAWLAVPIAAVAQTADEAPAEDWNVHAALTVVAQYHPPFRSPYRGGNSLDPGHRGDEGVNATLYAGLRLAPKLEFYADAEIDQGFALSDAVGTAGFLNGESAKIGAAEPYIRLTRAFARWTIGLGGASETLESDQHQLAGARPADRLVLTLGKFGVPDLFDDNRYAHDPATTFLNWSLVDAGAFDYAADSWGYSYGLAADWTQAWWSLRAGLFDMSRLPNGKALVRGLGQNQVIIEAEARHDTLGRPGTAKLLAWLDHTTLARYDEAVAEAARTGATPDVARLRRRGERWGAVLNLEQELADGIGAFLRLSTSDGHTEAFEFTDINRSASLGLALDGTIWDRPDDTLGLALVANALSPAARRYFAAGGLGLEVGDGALSYGGEHILETYYRFTLVKGMAVTADYQFVDHPAYNRARGPVSVFGLRLHIED